MPIFRILEGLKVHRIFLTLLATYGRFVIHLIVDQKPAICETVIRQAINRVSATNLTFSALFDGNIDYIRVLFLE